MRRDRQRPYGTRRASLATLSILAALLLIPGTAWTGDGRKIQLKPEGPGSGTIDGSGPASGDLFAPDCAWNGFVRTGDCEHTFAGPAEDVQLVAAPAAGWAFHGWEGTCPGTVSGAGGTVCSFNTSALNEQKTDIRPRFGAEAALVTVVPLGSGSGRVDVQGDGNGVSFTCRWDGETARGECSSAVHNLPETVTMTASPREGSTFAGYTGCPGTVSGVDGSVCTFTVTTVADDATVTATFSDLNASITVTADGNGQGAVTGTSPTRGQVILCSYNGATSGDCTDTVAGTDTIALVAAAATGSTASWVSCPGVVSGAGGTVCTVVVDSPADDFTARVRFAAPSEPGCTLTGTGGNDVLTGTPGRDLICGLGGDDTIRGMGGDDEVRGGAGNDLLYGGGGNDDLRGEAGIDHLYGREGHDTAAGGDGNDRVLGGAGPDLLAGGAGADDVYGNAGGDSLSGNAGDDELFGGDGEDLIGGGRGRDYANGGRGPDSCVAERRVSC
jgi:Ca2+-binding RTX toxin-like protein